MNNSSTTMFGFYVAASVMAFAVYNLVHICLIFKGRLLNVEYEQAMAISAGASIFQNPKAAKTFREGNSTMINIDLACAAMAFAGAIAALAMLSNGKTKKELSMSLAISSTLAFICLYASAKLINSATQFIASPVPLDDPQRYMNGLLLTAFVTRKIGHRLFFFSVALSAGWVTALEGLLMFAAVVILVLIYVINDTLSPAAIRRQNRGRISLLPLRIQNPTIPPRLYHHSISLPR